MKTLTRRVWCPLLFIAFVLTITYHLTSLDSLRHHVETIVSNKIHHGDGIPEGKRKLAVLLPASQPGTELCKVIVSATALGYPVPVILNWDQSSGNSTLPPMPSHLHKITGVVQFLEWALRNDTIESDRLGSDDLVLISDAYDVWMQLPPIVLLQRYFAINHEANQSLRKKFDFLGRDIPQQTILASAQKRCFGPRNVFSDLHCDEVPESPLPKNVFGFFTDYRLLRPSYSRARWLNSGNFIGPAGDMLAYFQSVQDRMYEHLELVQKEDDLSGDQGIFGEIFGEQEVWRKDLLEQRSANIEIRATSSANAVRAPEEQHVGLDYAQDLFYPTCHSETDGFFAEIEDRKALERESSRAGVTSLRIQGLSPDILTAAKPFAGLGNRAVQNHSWGEVPLYADFWTTAIPVAIHNNAWKKGLKRRQQTWWNETWFFPYLRDLLEARFSPNATGTVATLQHVNGNLIMLPYQARSGIESSYIHDTRNGSAMQGLWPADWSTVCSSDKNVHKAVIPWYDEVFRDGRGSI